MNSIILVLMALLLVAVVAVSVYLWQQRGVDMGDTATDTPRTQSTTSQTTQPKPAANSYTSTHGVAVIVYAPAKGSTVSNPVGVIGQVPGTWSFEAAFPVELQDAQGNTVARGSAQLLSDWTTTKLVPFSASLTYTSTPTGAGTLILHKDNESGLAKNDDEVRIPVHF
jgi:hypothetical protein